MIKISEVRLTVHNIEQL